MLIALFIDVKITVLKKGIQMETKEGQRIKLPTPAENGIDIC